MLLEDDVSVNTIVIDSEDRRQYALKVISLIAIDPPKVVIVEDYKTQRSNAQNARLWKLYSLVAEVTGYSAEEIHEFSLCRYFGFAEREVKDPLSGQTTIKRVPLKRSSARNKKEFADFMTSSEAWFIQDFNVWLDL